MGKAEKPAGLPAPGEGKRGEGGHLGYLLRQAAHACRIRMEQALADLDLTPPQFSVLTMLDAYSGGSNADLARLALLTPQTMSVIVANLIKAGLVERRPHAVHGRIQQIELTSAGRTALAAAKARVCALEADLAQGLTGKAEAAVRGWLAGLATGLAEG
ncbi:MarR family transcriptional regulator [Xanthobacter autotrophicus DSM 431]|uniref:MarR family winged helix-turn-helix transcriptional regulator n=1 Tax=Xanthobacter nonsaccharivorans TaxID=3119912 RepID=UPI00372706C9